MNAHKSPSGSAYFFVAETEKPRTHVLSVVVDNVPGVLARVIGGGEIVAVLGHAAASSPSWDETISA